MDAASWGSQKAWIQGFMYDKVAGVAPHLALKQTVAESITPEAVLGPCPVKPPQPCSIAHSHEDYHFSCLHSGMSTTWAELVVDTRMQQYTDLCKWL
ncbi:hypothetical protein ABBQ38_004649 [Trebouxia sp. C0009 RCD-2024]